MPTPEEMNRFRQLFGVPPQPSALPATAPLPVVRQPSPGLAGRTELSLPVDTAKPSLTTLAGPTGGPTPEEMNRFRQLFGVTGPVIPGVGPTERIKVSPPKEFAKTFFAEAAKRAILPLGRAGGQFIESAGALMDFLGTMPIQLTGLPPKLSERIGRELVDFGRLSQESIESISPTEQLVGRTPEGKLSFRNFRNPKAWTDSILNTFASMSYAVVGGGGTPIGAALIGSIQEAGPMFERLKDEGMNEMEAAARALAFGAVVGVLNRLSFGKALGGTGGKNALISAVTEAVTEYLEEPSEAIIANLARQGVTGGNLWHEIVRSLGDGLNVIMPTLLTGGLLGGAQTPGAAQLATEALITAEVTPPPVPGAEPVAPLALPEVAPPVTEAEAVPPPVPITEEVPRVEEEAKEKEAPILSPETTRAFEEGERTFHRMPDGTLMPGAEHEGAVTGSEFSVPEGQTLEEALPVTPEPTVPTIPEEAEVVPPVTEPPTIPPPASEPAIKQLPPTDIPPQQTAAVTATDTGEPADPATGQHNFALRVIADPRVESDYVRSGIKVEYQIKGNPETVQEAQNILNAADSLEQAMNRVMTDKKMPGETRVTASQIIALRLNTDAKVAESKGRHDVAQSKYDELIDFIDFVNAELALAAGRQVQAFAQWEELGPAGIMRKAQKEIAKAQEKAGKPDQKDIAAISRELSAAVQQELPNIDSDTSVREASSDMTQRGKEAIKKGLDRQAKTIWQPYREEGAKRLLNRARTGKLPPALKVFTDRLVSRLDKRIAELERDPAKPVKRKDPLTSLREVIANREKYQEVINEMRALTEQMEDPADQQVAEETLDALSGPPIPMSLATMQSAIRQAIRAMGFNIREIVTKPRGTRAQMVADIEARLMTELGLDADAAQDIADAISGQIHADLVQAIQKHKTRIINAAKRTRVKRAATTKWAKLVEAVNIGGFTDDAVYNALAEALNLPAFTTEFAAEITSDAEAVQTMEEGAAKERAKEAVLRKIRRQAGVDAGNLLIDIYYAGILSGHSTQMVNIINNALTGAALDIVQIVSRPTRAISTSKNILVGNIQGIIKGIPEYVRIVKTGEGLAPSRISAKFEARGSLEDVQFGIKGGVPLKGGVFSKSLQSVLEWWGMKPLNIAKYVFRTLQAADAVNKLQRKEARVRVLADEEADLVKRVEAADRLAEYATFTNKPRGTFLGWIANTINRAVGRAPAIALKIPATGGRRLTIPAARMAKAYIVPFTTIVSNVADMTLDFSPQGYLRTAIDAMRQNQDVPLQTRERLVQATLGTTAMMLAYGLTTIGDDEDEPFVRFHGAGPASAEDRRTLRAQGWKPYSVEIVGVGYVPIGETPFAVPISIVGGYQDALRNPKLRDKERGTRLLYATFIGYKAFLNNGFLRDFVRKVGQLDPRNPEEAYRNLRRNVSQTTSSLAVPNFVKQIYRLYDPTLYDDATIKDMMLRDIPVLNGYQVKPALDWRGHPARFTGNLGERFFYRFWSPTAPDKVATVLAKSDALSLARPPQKPPEMTEAQYYDYVRLSQQATYRMLKDYRNLDKMTEEAQDEAESKRKRIRKETRSRISGHRPAGRPGRRTLRFY